MSQFAAFKYPAYRLYWVSSFVMVVAWMIQEVVIGYELYRLTRDPLALAMVGLTMGLPYILLVMIGGHFADRYSKKYIQVVSMSCFLVCSVALWLLFSPSLGFEKQTQIISIYLILLCMSMCRGFFSPANNATMSFLVDEKDLGNASTWQSTTWLIGSMLGPAAAGLLYAQIGLVNTFQATLWLYAIGLVCILFLPEIKVEQKVEENPISMRESLKEGFAFTFNNKFIWYSTWLDLVAVLFGGVVAILPIFAVDILHVGAEGLGILRAAPALGGALTTLILTKYSPLKHAWRNLLVAVAGFGVATLVFAVSESFWLSVVALFFTGVTDSVSMVIRWTILQLVPPPEMRARVISVNSVFISTSNEIGAFESGVAARLLGTMPSVVVGGALALIFVGFVWLRSEELFEFDFSVATKG